MSKPVITVENLSKAYRIGLKEEVPDTLMSAVTGFMKAPLKKFHQLRKLDTFRNSGDEEDIYWALKDVSFEVQEGEVLGVIGRNGAGKSTLLKILSRITEPTSGRAVIRGRVSSLLEVGTGFHPELSGRENVYLNGTILGMTKREIDRKFDEIVDFSGVEKFLDTPIKRYSSGMKVRLAFAVAAHLEPEILIIDEVLAVGDAEFQKKCMGKMQDVARGGRTVLFVSHQMGAMSTLCSRVMWLDQGAVRHAGDVDDTIGRYLRVFSTLQSSTIDLTTIKTRHGGIDKSGFEFTRVDILNSGVLQSRSPVNIRISFRTNRPCDDVAVGIGFATMEGTRLLTLESDYSHSRKNIGVGEHCCEMRTESLPLTPNSYVLSIGGRSGDSFGLDYISEAAVIDVFPSGDNPGHTLNGVADVRLPADWRWKQKLSAD